MSPTKRLFVHTLMILSGTASLIYQVIWSRVLHYSFGNTDLAVTTVVAVFMGGLALGGYLGGRFASRLTKPVLVYGVLEGAIAIYAVAVTPLLYQLDFLYAIVGVDAGAGTLTMVRFMAAGLLMLVPTVFMGATLPIIAVPLVSDSNTGEGVGMLYFVNTLGAVIGSALAGFVLIRFLGLTTSLFIGAFLGLLVFLASAVVQRHLPDTVPAKPKPEVAEDSTTIESSTTESSTTESSTTEMKAPRWIPGIGDALTPRAGFTLILFAAAMSGYIALVNEIVWTRILGILLDGTVYGFSALLAAFLLGIALGSLMIAPFIDRSEDLWGLFARVQILAAVGATLTILLIPLVPSLVDAFLGEGTDVGAGFALKVLIVFLVILIPCLFFGAAFPVCVTIASRYRAGVSKSIGSIYAANTVGSILGALSGGMLLLPLTGDLNAILLMMVFFALSLALVSGVLSAVTHFGRARLSAAGERPAWMRRVINKAVGLVALPVVLLITIAAMHPDVKVYELVSTRYAVEDYDRSLGFKVTRAKKSVENIVWKAQGKVTVVTVHRLSDGGLRLRNNGLNESYHGTTEPRFAEVIFYLAALPYMFHPDPKTGLLIGLGGGGTAECLIETGLKKITVVELEPKVVAASRYMYKTLTGTSKHPLDDKRVTVRIDDGRNALLRAARQKPHQYDIIVSQPSHAWLSGVASLYTLEHFGIVRRNLRKGGIFCQWINLFRMDEIGLKALLRSFTTAFPRTHFFQVDNNSLLLIGGDKHLRLDPNVVKKRLSERRLKRNADLFSIDEYAVFRGYLFDRKTALAIAGNAEPNTDRFPIIEMRLPWILHGDTIKMTRLLRRKKMARGIRPRHLHRGKGFEAFLKGMAEDLISQYESSQKKGPRVKPFVEQAAKLLGAEGQVLSARLARVDGDLETAAGLFGKALAAGIDGAGYDLGRVLFDLGDNARAGSVCAAAYQRTKKPQAHLCKAEALYQSGRFDEALVVLRAIFAAKEHIQVPTAGKYLGILQYHLGRHQEAERLLADFAGTVTSDADAPYYLGLLHARAGRHDKAKYWLGLAVANSGVAATSAGSKGKRYARGGYQVAAIRQFQRAIALKRDQSSAYQWMARALRRWGRFEEMKQVLAAFADQDSSGASSFRSEFARSATLVERLSLLLWRNRKKLRPEPPR